MMSENTPQDNLIGKVLGQYQIEQEVGRGGMATVYRARQQSMNRTVAVKVLPRNLLHDPTFYERFEREVDVIAHLEHPHILPIYDYGQAESVPYIVMRFLGGGSLEQQIRRGLPDLNDLQKPLRQIAQALDYAHQQGIIHRDLKPGNIMLDEAGNAYLSDFGIARVLGSDLTGSMIIGTPAYMSPEQANGLAIDARSDIYALGIVLFELITGKEPYQAETPMAVLLKHINEPVPSIRSFREDVPEAVEDVIDKATAKDPDNRFSSAGEMAEAYIMALHNTVAAPTQPAPTPIMQAQPQTGAIEAPTGTLYQTGPPVEVKRGLSTGTLITILLVTVIIVGGGILGIILTQQEPPPEPVVNDQPPAIPTPFPRADTITQERYTISIPSDWIPPMLRLDHSEGKVLRNIWREDNHNAFVSLTIFDAELNDDPVVFRAAVDEYIQRTYGERELFHFLDEAEAEDGTIRRSYYFTRPKTNIQNPILSRRLGGIESGQLDVFLMQREHDLVIMEMYTAESTGNTLVPRMQFILDSLRVKPTQDPA